MKNIFERKMTNEDEKLFDTLKTLISMLLEVESSDKIKIKNDIIHIGLTEDTYNVLYNFMKSRKK